MRVRTIILLIMISCILSGCSLVLFPNEPYEFRQTFDQIVSIEILKKEYDSTSTDTPMNILKTIDSSMYKDVIDALSETPGGRSGMPPGTGFGLYIIRITYQDGEQEMIGNYNTGYILPNGEVHQDIYFFETEAYYSLISHILGEEITDYTHS